MACMCASQAPRRDVSRAESWPLQHMPGVRNSSSSQATNTGNARPNVITGVDYTSQSAMPRPDPEIPPLINVRKRHSSGLESGYVANEFTGHDRSIGASHPGLSSTFQYDRWNNLVLSSLLSQSTLNMDKLSAKAISQDAQQTSGYHHSSIQVTQMCIVMIIRFAYRTCTTPSSRRVRYRG